MSLHVLQNVQTYVCYGGEGPRRRGQGEVNLPPQSLLLQVLTRRTEGRRILEVGGCSKWDYYQNLPFGASGHHGSNICIEIGARASRRRAEGCLYVWDPCTSLETALTVQRALCTFRGEGHPVQKGHPCHPGAAKVGPNSLKLSPGGAQFA